MKDGIIKGTGDSRYLKGAGWPSTYAEFKSMAEAGALPFDLNGINAAGWQQIGDALSKANLLSDATAALWGGNSSSNVTDILKYAAARYGTCATAAATAAKVVTLSNFVLSVGAVIGVNFTSQNSAASPTLNVNGTGEKPIYCNGSVVLPFQITKTAYFQYDGTYWQILNPEAKIATGGYVGSGVTKALPLGFEPHLFTLGISNTKRTGGVGASHSIFDIGIIKYMDQFYPNMDDALENARSSYINANTALSTTGVAYDSVTKTIYLSSALNASGFTYRYTYL